MAVEEEGVEGGTTGVATAVVEVVGIVEVETVVQENGAVVAAHQEAHLEAGIVAVAAAHQEDHLEAGVVVAVAAAHQEAGVVGEEVAESKRVVEVEESGQLLEQNWVSSEGFSAA